jgi:hypothetical protein
MMLENIEQVTFIIPKLSKPLAATAERLEGAFNHFCSLASTDKSGLTFEVSQKDERVFIGLTSHALDVLVLTGAEELQVEKGDILFTSDAGEFGKILYTLADHEA